MRYDQFAHISSNLPAGGRAETAANLKVVRQALARLEAATLQEPGCLDFSIKESSEHAGEFYLWESWQDKTALKDHLAQPHTQHYFSLGYTKVLQCFEITAVKPAES